jgi:hypothetical protein
MPRFLQLLREFWPMPLPLMIHSAFALFAQRTRIPTSARSIGFCVIWVCISSSSSSKGSSINLQLTKFAGQATQYCNVGDQVYVYNLVGIVGLRHESGGNLSNLQVLCFFYRLRILYDSEAKSHKAKLHEKSGKTEFRKAIVRPYRFYQSPVVSSKCLPNALLYGKTVFSWIPEFNLRTISGGYQYCTKAVHHEKLMKNVS